MGIVEHAWFFGPFQVSLDQIRAPETDIKNHILLSEVKQSIHKDGLLNPIDLQWNLDDRFAELFIIRGNNRVQACKELGHQTIPAYIRVVDYGESRPWGEGMKRFLPLIRESTRDEAPALAKPQRSWNGRTQDKEISQEKDCQ